MGYNREYRSRLTKADHTSLIERVVGTKRTDIPKDK
jgi:hypothetical protein